MTAGSRLDRAGANRRAQRVRDNLLSVSEAIDTLIEIQERQDWLALGYKNWTEYCEEELGPTRLKLSAEQRGQVVAVLVASGMPKRRVAAALGVSDGTVRNDLKGRADDARGAQNYALPAGGAQVKAAAVVPPAADGEPASSAPPPAAGVGAPQEAGRPAPAVNPTETPGDSRSGGEGDVSALPVAQPPTVEGSTPGDETEAEVPADASPQQDTAEVDGEGQQESAGVSEPAVPSPDNPVELMAWMADLSELIDTDVHGPLLTDAELTEIGASLDRIAGVVELLTTWYVRAQQQ